MELSESDINRLLYNLRNKNSSYIIKLIIKIINSGKGYEYNMKKCYNRDKIPNQRDFIILLTAKNLYLYQWLDLTKLYDEALENGDFDTIYDIDLINIKEYGIPLLIEKAFDDKDINKFELYLHLYDDMRIDNDLVEDDFNNMVVTLLKKCLTEHTQNGGNTDRINYVYELLYKYNHNNDDDNILYNEFMNLKNNDNQSVIKLIEDLYIDNIDNIDKALMEGDVEKVKEEFRKYYNVKNGSESSLDFYFHTQRVIDFNLLKIISESLGNEIDLSHLYNNYLLKLYCSRIYLIYFS